VAYAGHLFVVCGLCDVTIWHRGAIRSSFRGGNFHEILFDDVIVLIQPWCNFFAKGHI